MSAVVADFAPPPSLAVDDPVRALLGKITAGIPAEDYHARRLDIANNGGLSIIDSRSAAHYHHWVTAPANEEESQVFAFGRALHCATLEPDVFRDTYVVLPADAPRDLRFLRNAKKPSDATKDAIAWWDEWEARCVGKTMLAADKLAQAEAMAAALRALVLKFPEQKVEITVADLIDECETEVTLYWVDEATGIICKARADLWSRELGLAMDLKSCLDASREAFAKAVHRHRYHVQHAHYCEGFRACGHPLRSFVFLPVEKEPPHVPASWHIDAPSEELGYEVRARSLRKLDACLKSGRWPGHTTTVESLTLPAYAFYNAQE